MNTRVLCAMSGGVDSSVAAYLLKKQGYEVVGLTMCLGVKDIINNTTSCCGTKAIDDAKRVCEQLDIPHFVLDFSEYLNKKVINNFVEQYRMGFTPNPCVDCNKHLKFDILLNKALCMDFSYLATGHYAQIEKIEEKYFLKKSPDKNKDQTYFLYPIRYEYLKNILFPIANLSKPEIRRIAKEQGLIVAEKSESQDICFIPDRDIKGFISKYVPETKKGDIVNLSGKKLGEHSGIMFYTIGQRSGLGISNKTPLYVVKIDASNNKIVVGDKTDLHSTGLIAKEINILINPLPENLTAKIRYAHKNAECIAKLTEDNKLEVRFNNSQESITPGQSIVLYDRDYVVAGGIIECVV